MQLIFITNLLQTHKTETTLLSRQQSSRPASEFPVLNIPLELPGTTSDKFAVS